MFVAVILADSKTKLVIPISWIYSLDIVQIFNRGVSHSKNHKIFYHKNKNTEPNFRLRVRNIFDENVHACYHAKILNGFGKE